LKVELWGAEFLMKARSNFYELEITIKNKEMYFYE